MTIINILEKLGPSAIVFIVGLTVCGIFGYFTPKNIDGKLYGRKKLNKFISCLMAIVFYFTTIITIGARLAEEFAIYFDTHGDNGDYGLGVAVMMLLFISMFVGALFYGFEKTMESAKKARLQEKIEKQEFNDFCDSILVEAEEL